MGNGFQRSDHLIVIHPFRSYNTDRSSHSLSKLIGRSNNAAVLHRLDRCLFTDINLDSCIIIIRKIFLYQLG